MIQLIIVVFLLIPTFSFAQSNTNPPPNLGEMAYSDIRFGDDYSSVSNKLRTFEDVGKYSYVTRTFYVTKNSQTQFNLYRISFQSYLEKTADYYETSIRNYWQNLVDVISEKYGSQESPYPDFLSHQSGYIIWTHLWTQGIKEIRIGVGSSASQYYAVLWITDLGRQQIVEERLQREEERAKKESSRKF